MVPEVENVDESGSKEKQVSDTKLNSDEPAEEGTVYKDKFTFSYEEQDGYLASSSELWKNFIVLPIITYSGFGRVVLLADDK